MLAGQIVNAGSFEQYHGIQIEQRSLCFET